MYTISKADFSFFYTYSDLGTMKHNPQAEADDAYKIVERAKKECGGTNCASIDVDNAARAVAKNVADRLDEKCLVSRDPAHCADLLSKDVANVPVVKLLLAEAKEVFDFVKIDRIDSMRIEALHQDALETAPVAVNRVDTRMNLVHDYVQGARKQAQFLAYLGDSDSFKQYYGERKKGDKDKIDDILSRCDRPRWEMFDFFTNGLTVHFKRLHKICCMTHVPLSAYPIAVQALRNSINKGLNAENGKFDRLLGEGARKQVADMIRGRFNMDGTPPPGAKVGLLDKHQIWTWYCDPFSWKWRSMFKVDGVFAVHVKEMIEFFVPLDADGSAKTRAIVKNDFLVSALLFNCLLLQCKLRLNYSRSPCHTGFS